MNKKTIVLSAGGTGGHLFPAEALAEELLTRGHRVIIFTDKRGSAFKSLGDAVDIHIIPAATLKPGILTKIKAVFDMGRGIVMAATRLMKIKPDAIVGFGGYPSFPAVFAGQCMGMTTILHEQNAVLGKANIFLADRARAIALSLANTLAVKDQNKQKAVVTGNPVRKNIVAVGAAPYAPPENDVNILITGGSQAASIFSAIVPAAAARLPENIRQRLRIMHQCREADVAETQQKYKDSGTAAEIRTFFSDMAERLSACHLFIGRSGASTVAEIAVAGRPALFVPLRHADMQQKHNAEALTQTGGGWMMMQEDFTPENLAALLENLIQNPARLSEAAAAARARAVPDAAKKLADMVENTIGRTVN